MIAIAVAPVASNDADDDGVVNISELGPLHQTNWQQADSDGDGIEDGREIGSNQFNPMISDTDGDKLNDSQELHFGSNASLADTDSDGLTDWEEFREPTDPNLKDSDGDGLFDPDELDNRTNPWVQDSDGDSLGDKRELELGSNPLRSDTDQDLLSDRTEVKFNTSLTHFDTDGDSLTDMREVRLEPSNPLEPDSDFDGLNDSMEVRGQTLVNVSDTDGDGLLDGPEMDNQTSPLNPDTDNDSLSDGGEVKTYATDPLNNDTDADYLLDGAEVHTYDTEPLNNDTDGDSLLDGYEIREYSTDPLAQDTDNDSLSDPREVTKLATDASLEDTDGDGIDDATEVDETAFDPTDPDPLREDIRSTSLSEEENQGLGDLVDTVVKLAHSARVGEVNATQVQRFGERACGALDVSTTGIEMTALDNFKQAGLYQALDLLSKDMGYSVSSSAMRGRLQQAINYGSKFSGAVAISDDLIRLQTQACNLVDGNPDNDDAALVGTVLSAGILVLDAYLLIQTGGTVGSTAIYKGAFQGTGKIAAKTGLARMANLCSWKCVGGIERLVHWSLRTGLETGKSEIIAAIVEIGYYDSIPIEIKDLLDGLTATQIRELLQEVASNLPEEVLDALEKAAQAILTGDSGVLFYVSPPAGPTETPQLRV